MHQSRLDALFRQQQLRRPCASLYQAFLVIRCQSETKKLARTTWPETHRPSGLGSSTGCWRDLCFWPLNFLAVINVLCLNGSNIPFNSWNHGYAFRAVRLRVIGITPFTSLPFTYLFDLTSFIKRRLFTSRVSGFLENRNLRNLVSSAISTTLCGLLF